MDTLTQQVKTNVTADTSPPPSVKKYRTIWISDVHLGTRGCKAEFLLDFLQNHESDFLFLVGDIVDGWELKSKWFWNQSHHAVMQKLLAQAKSNTKVVYIPGNHDEFMRDYTNTNFNNIDIVQQSEHITADGRRFLILHGDEFDGVVKRIKWLAILGGWTYNALLSFNYIFNLVRRKLGYSYWSISAYLKQKVKTIVSFFSNYDKKLLDVTQKENYDGIICGHIHKAEIRQIDNILYCNDGDWVESCTALVEDWDGSLSIIHWASSKSQ